MIASFNYLDAFQAYLSPYIVLAIGYIFGATKLFNSKDVSGIRRTLYLICVPAMLFRQIAIQKMQLSIWYPILVTILTQVTIHLLCGVICYLFPFTNKYLRFLQTLFATTHINFMFYGYPIAKALFGEEYIFVPITCCVVLFFLTTPIHSVLIFSPKSKESPSISEDASSDQKEDPGDDIELEDGIDKGTGDATNIEEGVNPDSSAENTDDVNKKEKTPKKPTVWTTLLWSFVNAENVCTVLGIIWCAIGVKLPAIMDQFTFFLEKCVVATGLLCSGVFMWEHPFCGCNWLEVGIYLLIHFVAIPCISALWCWVLKVPNKMAQLITLSHATPVGLTGYVMATTCGIGMQSASFSFFYSNLLSLPIFMLWTVVFKQTNLFKY